MPTRLGNYMYFLTMLVLVEECGEPQEHRVDRDIKNMLVWHQCVKVDIMIHTHRT